jgi:hypothetical protein
MRFDLKLKRNYVFVIFLIVLFASLGVFVYSYQQSIPNPGHGADSVWIFINGRIIDLQSAINGELFSGVAQSSGASPTSVSSGQKGSEILVKINGVEKNLQQAIDDGSICYRGGSPSSAGYSARMVEGHPATSVIITTLAGVEKNLQQAIDDGEFCQYSLSVSHNWPGPSSVTSSSGGISCGSSCSANYAKGKSVTLSASPPQYFAQWTGKCAGSPSSCNVVVDSDTSLGVVFSPYCGDSVCNGGESCSSCSGDCGACPPPPSGGGGGGS